MLCSLNVVIKIMLHFFSPLVRGFTWNSLVLGVVTLDLNIYITQFTVFVVLLFLDYLYYCHGLTCKAKGQNRI